MSASLALDSTLENSEEQHNWQANIYQSGSTVSDSKGDPTQNSTLNNKVTDQAYTVLDDREIGKTRSELIEFEVQASDVINEVNFDREQARQLIVIDGRIDDIEAVISDVLSRGQSDVEFDFILLDSETDGIDAISQALNSEAAQQYDAVHILAHGSDAQLQLGSTNLNSDNLESYQNHLAGWASGMTQAADILLYGCDVAQTADGQWFVDQISQFTGADIAASDDLTGHESLGGDWEFEYIVGSVESEVAFSHAFQSDYLGTFATVDVTTWLDTVDGNTSSIAALTAVGGAGADNVISLREAIIAVNNGAGGDTIQLGSGDYKLTIMTGTGDAHGDLDIDEDVEIIGMADGSTVIDASLLTGESVFSVVNGDATFQNLTITGGDKIGDGGGIHVESGVQVIVDNVVVTDNSATGSGGGIYNAGTLTVSNSTISDNKAGNSGGGISASNGAIQINNVTVSNNEATNDGGGVFLSNGTHNLTNVTISGNTAGDEGGGVFVRKLATGNHYYNTITDNTAGDKGGGLRNEFSGGTVKVTGSIIAGNRGPTGSPDDVSGTIDPPATSIIGGSTVNLLEPLADNGGPAETHALKPGSLGAINQGGTATAGETDGRGYTIADTIRDIGAFELGGIPPAGTNDAPIITDGPDTVNLTESNAGLAITGDFTVADVDLADSVTAMVDSVVAGGTGLASSSLDNATLTSFLSVSPTAVLNNTQTSNTLTWNFDSANEAFDFLAAGETLILTYTVSVTDDATPSVGTDTETVTVTITGTNDDPVAQVDTNAAIEDGAIVNGTLTNTDEDTNDTHTYSLINGTAKGTATVQSNGDYSFDPGADFQDLALGETRDVTFTYEVEDNNGATSRADVTITITGTNDTPIAQVDTNAAFEDGAVVNGTLTNTDEDTICLLYTSPSPRDS